MWKFIRLALVSATILLPLASDRVAPAIAQERQGCFMINQTGRLIELDEFCPTAAPFAAPATASTETGPSGQPLGTGDIQVTLRWTTVDDLDLSVTDPAGDVVAYYNPAIASGGQLDVDANAGCGQPNGSPIENIFWPTGGAPQGQYTIEVNLFTRCESSSEPISFSLRVLVQGTTRTFEGTVSDSEPVASFPFSLPVGQQ